MSFLLLPDLIREFASHRILTSYRAIWVTRYPLTLLIWTSIWSAWVESSLSLWTPSAWKEDDLGIRYKPYDFLMPRSLSQSFPSLYTLLLLQAPRNPQLGVVLIGGLQWSSMSLWHHENLSIGIEGGKSWNHICLYLVYIFKLLFVNVG